MRCYFLLIFSFLGVASVCSNDTVVVMHYNLMYYDKYTEYCTASNNNVDSKDGYLTAILAYLKPDILTVNEVNGSIASVERILVNTLNVNGETKYRRANFSGSYLVNMLYYNSDKLALKSQAYINTSPRQTDVYRLYLKSDKLYQGDTVFLTCLVTHLKAGTNASDEADRANAAQGIMSYINANNISGNVLVMGDMNLYGASEQAFINLTTTTASGFRFYDPIDKVGGWHESSTYKAIHTQSTHTQSTGCHSTGGFDDRFDFILSSNSLLQGSNGIRFFNYRAVGQDGKRFNQSLLSPENTSIPTPIVNALYNMSDHLPVVMKLILNGGGVGIGSNGLGVIEITNPFSDQLLISNKGEVPVTSVSIYSLLGVKVNGLTGRIDGGRSIEIAMGGRPEGVYLVEVLFESGYRKTYRVVKR
jgi:hypothetical protein